MGSSSAAFKPNGDGSASFWTSQTASQTGPVLSQKLSTVPGHRYKLTFTASKSGSNRAQVNITDGGSLSPNLGVNQTQIYDGQTTVYYTASSSAATLAFKLQDNGQLNLSNLKLVDLSDFEITTINHIDSKTTIATGTGEPGGAVSIKNGSTTIGATTVDSNGQYSVTIPTQPFGDTITATVTKDGNTSNASTVVTQADLVTTTIDGLTNKSTAVTGKGEPFGTVTIKNGTTILGTGMAASDGTYSITIPAQPSGNTVTATITKNGKSSNIATTVVIQDDLKPTTINDLTTMSTTVSGKAEPNASIVIKNSAGTEIASGKVDGNGNYSFTIAPPKYNDTITAMASLNGKNSSSSTKVQDTSTPNKPTVNPVTDQDTSISGKGTPGDKVQFTIGGQPYLGTINDEGEFSIVVPKIQGGTVVNVVEVNPNNGNRSTPTEVTVRDTTLAKPTISPIKTGDTKVVITGEPGATIVLTTPDREQTSKTADAAGKATFTVDPAKVGDTFTATQTGANGKASPAATANVTAVVTTGTITTKDFTLGKDKNIEGTYTGDVKSFRVTIDGTVYAGGAINTSSKTYSFYALDKITQTGSFKIEGLDASGRVLDTKTENIVANQTPNTPGTGTITANAFTIHQDKTVTGRLTGDVTSIGLIYNGTEYRGGTVNSDGTYSFYALNTITDKTKPAVMNGYDRNGNRIATSAITLYDAQDSSSSIGTSAMTAHNFVLGVDRNITGTFTGDVRSLGVTIGGVDYRGGSLNADGTFNFYAWDKIKNTTDAVVVNGYDRNGNRIATSVVSVTKPSSSGTITPNTFMIPTDRYLTASYTGDVKVTINGVDYTGGTVSGGQVNFYIGDKIKSTSDNVTIAALDRNGRELDSKTVQLVAAKPAVGIVTPATFSLKTSSVTGTYTGEAKSVRLTVNGTVLPAGGSVTGGQFSYYVGMKNKITSTSDQVKIELLDKNGLVMDTKTVSVSE